MTACFEVFAHAKAQRVATGERNGAPSTVSGCARRPSELAHISASTPAGELVVARSFDAHARGRRSGRNIQHMRGEPGHGRCTSRRSGVKMAARKSAYTPYIVAVRHDAQNCARCARVALTRRDRARLFREFAARVAATQAGIAPGRALRMIADGGIPATRSWGIDETDDVPRHARPIRDVVAGRRVSFCSQ